jgi:ABC-2 type transport system ATP-binding protein
LNDVESLCDRVAILRKGEVVVSGRISDLLRRDARRTEITLSGDFASLQATLESEGLSCKEVANLLVVQAEGAATLKTILERALALNLGVEQVIFRQETI